MEQRHTGQTSGVRPRAQGGRDSDAGRNPRDEIIDWRKDAYAMERGLESSLEKQSRNDHLDSMVRERATSHLAETRRHAEAVRAALQALGSDTSGLKTGMGMMTQAAKGIGSAFARDERIKDLLDAYSMEHFEIASYTALAAAAERAGLVELADTCRRIIPDEQRMAEALIQALPNEVIGYVFEAATAQE
jgi:ferritin-like metal-binding protein YciE